ncbi:MAG TPA: dolichol monophosphate mannose synthase [Clostridiales bacterium]|nr:dolichol monophosphate mannose synthase [Clostridiales bacterium]
MKIGIYYAFWEQQWQADYRYYIAKAARLGFDILEIACTPLPAYSRQQLTEIRDLARDCGLTLTAGHGPSAGQNLGSPDPAIRKQAVNFYTDLLQRLQILDIHILGGGIYSYWPADYSQPVDKAGDWARSVAGIREIAPVAANCGVTLCLEVLNRFEGYLLNTAEEGLAFLQEVNHPAAGLMLDTFHMNIEEDDLCAAIRLAGRRLSHFHIGECNRKLPGTGRMPWQEIGRSLSEIGYQGAAVMEPFIRMGGQVGSDIKVWRDLSNRADEEELDRAAAASLQDMRRLLGDQYLESPPYVD